MSTGNDAAVVRMRRADHVRESIRAMLRDSITEDSEAQYLAHYLGLDIKRGNKTTYLNMYLHARNGEFLEPLFFEADRSLTIGGPGMMRISTIDRTENEPRVITRRMKQRVSDNVLHPMQTADGFYYLRVAGPDTFGHNRGLVRTRPEVSRAILSESFWNADELRMMQADALESVGPDSLVRN